VKNYVAIIIVKIWNESSEIKSNLNELYINMLINASHKCTKTMIINNLHNIYNMRKAHYDEIESMVEYNYPAQEMQIYIDIDNLLSTGVLADQVQMYINRDTKLQDTMNSFVLAEYTALKGIADVLILGYLNVNEDWFVFDSYGFPTDLKPGSNARAYSGCDMGSYNGNIETKKREFLRLLREYSPQRREMYETMRDAAKSENRSPSPLAYNRNSGSHIISLDKFTASNGKKHYIVSKNMLGRIRVKNAKTSSYVSKNTPGYNEIAAKGKILRRKTQTNVSWPFDGGKRKLRKTMRKKRV